MRAKFILSEQSHLLGDALSKIELPDGIMIRAVAFDTDIGRAQQMIADRDEDSIVPTYGMSTADDPGELCLVAERGEDLIGQISCTIEALGGAGTNIELWVSGLFVTRPERGYGVSRAIGEAAVALCEAWRRQIATNLDRGPVGAISVSADTLPGSAGETVIERMVLLCENLEEQAEMENSMSGAPGP